MKKLNRQERVVEEVKLAIKPYYNKGKITKDEYKEIMRKAVPKVNLSNVAWHWASYLNKLRRPRYHPFIY